MRRATAKAGDVDIFQKANRLIKQYGDAAPLVASSLADQSRLTGNTEAEEEWLRILWAAEELLAKNFPKGAGIRRRRDHGAGKP